MAVIIETINRIPINSFKWQINKTIRTVRFVLAILKPGDFLGHEEIANLEKYKCDAV